ncbi:MAG TPA: anti-sigma factor, partial [Vicinamibacteria bacterium]
MTNCREAEALIERHLDREASPTEELALTEHLAGCAACRQWLELEASVDAGLLAAFAGAEPTPNLAARVRDRCRREASGERWGWIADALNAVGGLAMLLIGTRMVGALDPPSVVIVVAITAGVVALGLYPLWLARLGGPET